MLKFALGPERFFGGPFEKRNGPWEVTRLQYGISTLVPQTSFRGQTSGGVPNCRLFSQVRVKMVIFKGAYMKFFYIPNGQYCKTRTVVSVVHNLKRPESPANNLQMSDIGRTQKRLKGRSPQLWKTPKAVPSTLNPFSMSWLISSSIVSSISWLEICRKNSNKERN